MSIRREEIMPLLIEACPSYSERWSAYVSEPEFDDELTYVHLGDFARHLVELLQSGQTCEFSGVFSVIERLHVEGDSYTKEAATVGALESLQNVAGNSGIDPNNFEPFLEAVSRHWWRHLNDFWGGKRPRV